MMPPRASLTRVLEWGQLSDDPGSQVFDDAGAFVFTSSRVCASADQLQVGLVTQLISPSEIEVVWSSIAEPQRVSPREVHVVVALHRT